MWDMLAGVMAGASMYLFGYYMGSKNKVAPKEKDTSICSCTHGYSMHKDTGACNVTTSRYIDYEEKNYKCPCVRYDGVPPAHIYMKDL